MNSHFSELGPSKLFVMYSSYPYYRVICWDWKASKLIHTDQTVGQNIRLLSDKMEFSDTKKFQGMLPLAQKGIRHLGEELHNKNLRGI